MSNYVDDYTFNSMGRIGMDQVDATQQNMQNTRFANYMLSSFFSENTSDAHVKFATQQPMMMVGGTSKGAGLTGATIDTDNDLMFKKDTERDMHKLQLHQRPFITVPYLGRGSCDPTLELQMLQGDMVAEKKSVGTIMDKSFMGYTLYPTDSTMDNRTSNASYTVEEAAMDGWVRGGEASRELGYSGAFSKSTQP
jgi:hypothetical protein